MKVSYVPILEVKHKLPDGEFLCLQKVYPVEDGTKRLDLTSYRFIRTLPTGQLKAQRGQAQVEDLGVMKRLVAEMEKKEAPTTI